MKNRIDICLLRLLFLRFKGIIFAKELLGDKKRYGNIGRACCDYSEAVGGES